MANDPRPHLKIDGYNQSLPYQYPRRVNGPSFTIVDRNRAIHGNSLKNQLNTIREQFQIQNEAEISESIVRDDVVYVEFTSVRMGL